MDKTCEIVPKTWLVGKQECAYPDSSLSKKNVYDLIKKLSMPSKEWEVFGIAAKLGNYGKFYKYNNWTCTDNIWFFVYLYITVLT